MFVIGVDVGGTKVLARRYDLKTQAAEGWAKKATPSSGVDDVVSAILDVVDDLDPKGEALAIGLGVPGPVDADGVVAHCPNIEGWDHPVKLEEILTERTGKPVAVGNDVNVAALAEYRAGAGKGSTSMLAVFVGTGVGGGLILNNQLVAGPRGLAGEIGHVTVRAQGRPCGCGGSGHLEAYAGKAGIAAEALRLNESGHPNELVGLMNGSALKSSHLLKALKAKCPVTQQLVDDAAHALAQAVGNAATLCDIDCVVFGGGIVDRLGQKFLDQIRASLSFGGFGADICEFRLAERLDDAGAVGAGLLAVDLVA